MAGLNKFVSPRLVVFSCKGAFLQSHSNFNLLAENILRQCLCFPGFISFLVFPEIFKIAAVIENQEAPFIRICSINLIHAGQALTQTGATSNHLPKLCLGAHLLEKHQIDAFRHINTSVHHIHGHGNMRLFLRLFEIIYDGLSITIITNHALGKWTVILRVEFVKPLQNKFSMAFILRKDNGFTQPISTCDLDTSFHQIL